MRKIITYSTLGDNMKEIFSAATNLGELQADLSRAGIRYEGMKLMTNPGQVTLESLQAELPSGEFQLFIMPQKVKSGHTVDDEDMNCIDEEDGITWDEEDWSIEDPEFFAFISRRDLAIARAKRAFALLEKSVEYLAGLTKKAEYGKAIPTPPADPILANLRAEAAKLQKNMEVFG